MDPTPAPEEPPLTAEEALDEGVLRGLSRALLAVFEARGIPLEGRHIDAIQGCADASQLTEWVRAAVLAEGPDAVFPGAPA